MFNCLPGTPNGVSIPWQYLKLVSPGAVGKPGRGDSNLVAGPTAIACSVQYAT